MASTSSIRAFVQWKQPTVFSGEEIECVITFKNTASVPDTAAQEQDRYRSQNQDLERAGERAPDEARLSNPRYNGGLRPRFERQRTVTQSTGASASRGHLSTTLSAAGTSSRVPSSSKGHRPTLSLNVVPSPVTHTRTPSASTTPQTTTTNATTRPPPPRHGRSLSIMSLHADSSSPNLSQKSPPMTARRPATRGHSRSASLQFTSRPSSAAPTPVIGFPSPRQPSPLQESSPDLNTPEFSFPHSKDYLSIRPSRRKSGVNTDPNTPAIVLPATAPSSTFATDFAFPAHPSSLDVNHSTTPDFEFPPKAPINIPKPRQHPSRETLSTSVGSLNPISRILSDGSANGTPRSSSDFYSFSNNSSDVDTLASGTPVPAAHLLPKTLHGRNPSRTSSASRPKDPEVLMMGYAQTMGSFVLDGSLVNQAPFEEVKRKGVLGGQGSGGVVGVERSKRESGMFGAFGWGSIGESLGGLLGAGEMSSIKEMRGVASTKTIPLLSTPQSILFVDLRLAPGESRSYTYRFQLPGGLPPTHKGRAIKVNYHIKIGVQRSGSLAGQQNIRHIEVPFRVLGSVNDQGESLGHDLMSPYILLYDQARTASIATPDDFSLTIPNFPSLSSSALLFKPSPAALDDFLDYADHLLTQPPSASDPLLSPSAEGSRRRSSTVDTSPTNMKEAIDLAILRSNQSSASSDQPSQSTNRFTIARAGQHVAVLSMLRPAYRLGETVIGVLDFLPPPKASASSSASSAIPTYAITIALETVERIDPSLALRSASSVQRATRKIYASTSETVLFAHQTSFRLEVPTSATPTFETTGVHLSWRLRVEFVTAMASTSRQNPAKGLGIIGGDDDESDEGSPPADSSNADDGPDDLLEEVVRDERGVVLVAKERLVAETFEVAVPIKVFGFAGLGGESAFGNREAEPLEV